MARARRLTGAARAMGEVWEVQVRRGPAAALHALEPPEPARRQVWVLEVDAPALVLGSTQPEGDVDPDAAAALGVQVARRRSGGGAVLLDPGEVLWVDVVVPRGDPLWDDDVGRAAHWFGEAWAAALHDVGVPGAATVHRQGLVRGPLGAVVCFAGLGPGEVRLGGGKVVGISQRRTRGWARLQASVPLTWRPDRHAALLAPGLARALSTPGGSDDGDAAGPRSEPSPSVEVDAAAAVAEVPVAPLGEARREALLQGLLDRLRALP